MSLNLSKTFGLIRPMTRSLLLSTSTLTRFAVNGVEAALALDFIGGEYRTANTSTTFADAFTGTSPKLTYSTTSNSTMVNSAGNIVWAPHNLALNSATPATQTIAVRSGAQYTVRVTGAGSMALSGAGTGTATDGSPATITASTTSLTITLTGSLDTVAVYRSDLGGMHPVPGADTGFEYYVPTSGNAEYLPRVGHHVYNGTTWVNEGLLIESEPRTNLEPKSEDFSTFDNFNVGSRNVNAIGPDGQTSATTIVADNVGGTGSVSIWSGTHTVATSTTYTFSAFLKAGTLNWASIATILFTTPANVSTYFDLENGVVGTVGSGHTATIQAVGNEWYRCSVTFTTDAVDTTGQCRVGPAESDGDGIIPLDGVSSIQVYGLQLDQGKVVNGTPVDAPTPSSYIPTSGSTVTRGGQSLTVPPAEFGWPEPEYIGSELVTNGDFATDTTGWSGVNSTLSVVDQRLRVTNTGAFGQARSAAQTVEVGKVYQVTAKLVDRPAVANVPQVVVGTSSGGTQYLTLNGSTGATSFDFSGVFVATTTSVYISLLTPESTDYADWDNISVKEINPLSVSLQMDGRMTYADENSSTQAYPWRWHLSSADRMQGRFYTNAGSGGFNMFQAATGGGSASVGTSGDLYSPGINVPFNIASRHGSTFVNGAVDGVALDGTGWEYGDTTPTALPDLSGTDLQIAYDFMGTIGQFRQFAGDIGDAGLVTATNPSTEPTLSLTFDGTGGSFYNLNWSE